MADLQDLLVRIDATTESLRRELKRAEKATDQTTGKMGRALEKMEQRFGGLDRAAARARAAIGAVVGALAVRQVSSFVQSQIKMVDAIGKAAQVAGVTTNQIQELRFAFGQLAQVSDTQVDETLRRFNRRLGLARDGSKAYADTMKKLGVDIRQGTSPALEQAIDGLARIKNAADRSAAAAVVFGDDVGPKLAAALGQGISSVDDLRRALHADGGVISSEQIERAAELAGQMDKLRRILSTQMANTVLDNAEALEDLTTAMGKAAGVAVSLVSGTVNFIQGIAEGIASIVTGTNIPLLEENVRRAEYLLSRSVTERAKRGAQANLDAAKRALEAAKRVRAEMDRMQREAEESAKKRFAERAGRDDDDEDPPAPKKKFVNKFLGIDDKFIDDAVAKQKEVQALFRSTRTEVEQIEAQIARVHELSAGGFFSAAGIDDAQILERLQAQLDSMTEQAAEATSEMTVFAEQAARNMQDAFADFLFDPFQDGLDGMLKGFSDILQRMWAEYAASQLFSALGGAMSGSDNAMMSSLGNFFGGARAGGGPVSPGKGYLVGERGPEIIIPKMAGQVIPNHALGGGGGVQVNVYNQGQPMDATVTQSHTGGMHQIDVMLENKVNEMFHSGKLDRAMSTNFGSRRRGR